MFVHLKFEFYIYFLNKQMSSALFLSTVIPGHLIIKKKSNISMHMIASDNLVMQKFCDYPTNLLLE
jgi:hypothetical protein